MRYVKSDISASIIARRWLSFLDYHVLCNDIDIRQRASPLYLELSTSRREFSFACIYFPLPLNWREIFCRRRGAFGNISPRSSLLNIKLIALGRLRRSTSLAAAVLEAIIWLLHGHAFRGLLASIYFARAWSLPLVGGIEIMICCHAARMSRYHFSIRFSGDNEMMSIRAAMACSFDIFAAGRRGAFIEMPHGERKHHFLAMLIIAIARPSHGVTGIEAKSLGGIVACIDAISPTSLLMMPHSLAKWPPSRRH